MGKSFCNQESKHRESDTSHTAHPWNFSTMPSENWKNGVGSALTAYAAGTGSWDDVVTAFVDGWASEAALNAAA